MPNMSGPTCVSVATSEPLLFLTPFLIRPTSYPRYARERDGCRVTFTNFASENLEFFMEKPAVVPFNMARIKVRGGWADHFFTVMRDSGRYRMWFEAQQGNVRHDTDSHVRYVESEDGVDWTAPATRLYRTTTHGVRNRVYPVSGHRSHGVTVFKDPTDAKHPYKLVGYGKSTASEDQIEGARSADGLKWEPLPNPLVPRYMSDTQSVAAYDARKGKYVGFFRYTYLDRRGIGYAETTDFQDWPRPEPLIVSSSLQGDIYTNGYTVYPHNDSMRFLFAAIYKKNRDSFGVAAFAGLDSRVWSRVGTETFLDPEDVTGQRDALVSAGVGLVALDGGRRVGLPVGYTGTLHNAVKTIHGGRPPAAYYWAVWDRERLGGVRCDGEGGFTTVRLRVPPKALRLNFRTGLSGEIRVQVRDDQWEVVPGYSFGECRLLNGDNATAGLTWGRRRVLPSRPNIALEFYLRNAVLYSMTVP